MKTCTWPKLAVALACSALLGCTCGGGNGTDGGTGGGGGGGGGGAGGGAGGGGPVAECDKPANVAKKHELTSAQPVLGVRSKSVLTVTVSFPSEADDPQVQCSVDLKFKDSNGSGTLDVYEDWRKAAAERAADLLPRLSATGRLALMAHATTTDAPASGSTTPSAATQAMISAGLRFGLTAAANDSSVTHRAAWANAIQETCEATALGVPFVLSVAPSHSSGSWRQKAKSFSQWPAEAGLAASRDPALVKKYGQIASQEYRAIGVRMLLGPSADLYTEPRWINGQFTFGENATNAGAMVKAYVEGVQGTAAPERVACVVGQFPGAGPAKGGFDARLEKGRFSTYPANAIDTHLSPFGQAFEAGVAAVMPGYAIPETGEWTGLSGVLAGQSIEQVGAAFNHELLTDALRGHYQFQGLVLAPWGVLEDKGVSPFGAPWGVETLTRVQRLAKAVGAGVDQFGGLNDTTLLSQAKSGALITDAQIDAAAGRALALIFGLGLFENPYVDADQAPALVNTDTAYRAGLDAMNRGTVLIVNVQKPAGWLNGSGDGTQVGDKGNAGNGTLKVLPAPPGEPYVAAGCSYFIMGNFDLDYVRSVSAGYGELTNDATSIKGVPVTTAAERIALSDYVFIRIDSPYTVDPASGSFGYPLASLEYAGSTTQSQLDDLIFARNAIDSWTGEPASKTQIVVAIDSGRVPVVSEVLQYNVSGLYLSWNGTLPANPFADKVLLDVAFGIVDGVGKLPVGLPLSNAAAAAQKEDLAGDGQHATFVEGFGLDTPMFQ